MEQAQALSLRVAVLAAALLGCARRHPVDAKRIDSSPPPPPAPTAIPAEPRLDATPADATPADATPARAPVAIDGPHEILLEPGRPIYYALPRDGTPPYRLVAHLHGMCGPPSYACGKWLEAGVEIGAMVCPTGNARCGDSPVGPPSWEAPSWKELLAIMDQDLETSIAKVSKKRPGAIRRDGAVLTGYSRGAYAAAIIARMHKDRWPYVVLIEANVSLTAASLKAAGVRAVALVAGDQGTEIAGERATAEALDKDGFPARLFVMKNTGHLYSEDMPDVMRAALAFVLEH